MLFFQMFLCYKYKRHKYITPIYLSHLIMSKHPLNVQAASFGFCSLHCLLCDKHDNVKIRTVMLRVHVMFMKQNVYFTPNNELTGILPFCPSSFVHFVFPDCTRWSYGLIGYVGNIHNRVMCRHQMWAKKTENQILTSKTPTETVSLS